MNARAAYAIIRYHISSLFGPPVPAARWDPSQADDGLPRKWTVRVPRGVNPFALFKPGEVDVLVDGVSQRDVVAYDAVAGEVECYLRGESGSIALNHYRNEADTETVRGRVEVRWKRR